jgi:Spy/CpxP family protein refolding chaperone
MGRKVLIVSVLAMMVAGFGGACLFAQEQPPAQEQPQGNDMAEWVTRSLKEGLGLTDEQTAQVKQIISDGAVESDKIRVAGEEKVKAILNEEQKAKYDEMLKNMRGGRGSGGQGRGGDHGDRGGRRGGMFGNMDRMLGGNIDDIKQKLGLTDEQTTQVKAILDEAQAKGRKEFENLGPGGIDINAIRGKVDAMRKEVSDKITALLTEEQKPKYVEMEKQVSEQINRFTEMARGFMGGQQHRESPEEKKAKLVDGGMKALALPDEEAAAVKPIVDEIAALRIEGGQVLEDARKALRDALANESIDKDTMKAELEKFRKAKADYDKKLGDAMGNLRAVVTFDQEAKLVGLGLLE